VAVITVIAALWLFYVFYVFTMGVYRVQLAGKLTGLSKVLLMPFVVVAVLMDVLCQVTVATVAFAELPKELLVTARLQRYIAGDDGWRKTIAVYICNNLLDPFDPNGKHC
jgi:hypothetical protein